MEIDNSSKDAPLKVAEDSRKKADERIKPCCMYDPDYLGAVPNYERACKSYHAAQKYEDEIACRDKLVICHRNLKDTYSEGRCLEMIAEIYVLNLNKFEEAYKYIQNAALAFRTKGDYKYEMNSIVKLAASIRDKKDLDYTEKVLKIAYDEINHISHIVTLDKDHSYDYIYKAMTNYVAVLIIQNKLKETISTCQDFIKAFEPYEEKKDKIIVYYGLMAIGYILIEDFEKVETTFEEAKKICQNNSDYETIYNIQDCWKYLKEGDEKRFNNALRIVDVDYDNAVTKKLKGFFTYYKDNIRKDDSSTDKKTSKVLDKEITIKSKHTEDNANKDTERNFADDQL